VVINIISHVLSTIVFIVYKSEILKACAEIFTSSRISDSERSSRCNEGYDDILKSIIMSAVISTILSVCNKNYIYLLNSNFFLFKEVYINCSFIINADILRYRNCIIRAEKR
jgi:hypothetical protein